MTKEASTRPLPQPKDNTSANIVRDTPSPLDAETGAEAEMSDSEGDIEILNVGEDKGEDVSNTVVLEKRTIKLDEGQAGSDHDFIVTVYLKVHECLKHTTEEHVYIENPPSSFGTIASMKNLDGAFTYGDQFLYDKPTKEEPEKVNVETKVESMVTVPIHQASLTAPLLSTPDQTAQALSSRISTLENHDLYSKIDKYINENVKEAIQNSLKVLGRECFGEFSLFAPEASMDHENLEEFMDVTAKSRKRRRDDQDPPPPPPKDLDQNLEYIISGDKDRRHALLISKLKATYYQDFRLEELVPSLWIESEREYDVSAAYGISHWWFKRKEFYITRHSAPFDRRAIRSHKKILSVISLKTFSRYGYTFLREIVIRKADYKEYKISEADFKNLHPNDFKDLYLLHLQGNLNHLFGADKVHLFNAVNTWIRNLVIRKYVEDLQLRFDSYQTKLNLTQPNWMHMIFYSNKITLFSTSRGP
nr:hypothetical protein [Tanacetum cinerariifolium]